jgi:recombination protein RecA
MGLIKKSGAFFSWGDTRLGQGRENARNFLVQKPEITKEIEQKVRASAIPSVQETAKDQ